MTVYLTSVEVLAIHYVLIRRYGGSDGIRDLGALESSLFRPRSGYYEDIIQEAAALWESLTKNHPFIDGNKRIGFAAADTFLRINGYRISASPNDVYKLIIDLLESGEFDYRNLESWLRNNIKKTD